MNKRLARGFTLLEVLIAIAIFSLISMASFTIFQTVLSSDEKARLRHERLNELQRAFLVMERDIQQMARRSVRLNGEAPLQQYLFAEQAGFFDAEQTLGFVRGGWTNPMMLLPRGDMQSVAYQLADNTLSRLHYNFVDPVVGAEPSIRPLLSQVKALSFKYYDGKKWQENYQGSGLPLAIAVIIDLADFGEIRRQFLVAGEADDSEVRN